MKIINGETVPEKNDIIKHTPSGTKWKCLVNNKKEFISSDRMS